MSDWKTRLLQLTLKNGLSGTLDALALDGCSVLFRRESESFRVVARRGRIEPDFSYGFLEDKPWLLQRCFSTGYDDLGGSDCHLEGTGLFVATDQAGSPSYFILFESRHNDADASEVHSVLSSLLKNGLLHMDEAEASVWPSEYVEKMASIGGPFLLQAEPGSDFESVASAYCKAYLGSGGLVCFDPSRLSDDVQLREVFGDRLGARLSGGAEIVPLVERGYSAIVIKEPGRLSDALQEKLCDDIEMGHQSIDWIFCSTIDLEMMSNAGKFNHSLLSFLANGKIELEPIRMKPEVIRAEVELVAKKVRRRYGRYIEVSDASWEVIMEYGWPGNHEELRSVIFESMLLATGAQLQPANLRIGKQNGLGLQEGQNMRTRLALTERKLVLESYAVHSGNQVHMARSLGISRGSLQYKLEKFGFLEQG